MPADRERQLILDAQEGNHGAFRQIVELHMRRVYDLAYGFVNDHDDAQDVTQEVFVKVYQAIKISDRNQVLAHGCTALRRIAH